MRIVVNPVPAEYLTLFILGAGIILMIGFLGRAIARKTSIPHIIWLMLFGIVLGPILGVFSRQSLLSFAPFITGLVIMLVLFNAGLNLSLTKLLRSMSKAVTLSLVNFVVVVLLVALVMYFIGFSIILSILLGSIVAGVSSSAITSITQKINRKDKDTELVEVESTISEPLGIILVLVLIGAILLHNYSLEFISTALISEFSIGILLGGLVGVLWVPLMGFFQRKRYEYSYVASLALVFLLYVGVQAVNGSGPASALVFGIVIANGEGVFRSLHYRHETSFTLSPESKDFNNLVTFITASFFFVYFGTLISLTDYAGFIIGIMIAIVIFLSRQIGTRMALYKSAYSTQDKMIVSSMVSRGIGAAVVAALPIVYGIEGSGAFLDIVFAVIFVTIFINSTMVLSFRSKNLQVKPAAGE